jgi:hypothetical protein
VTELVNFSDIQREDEVIVHVASPEYLNGILALAALACHNQLGIGGEEGPNGLIVLIVKGLA